MSGYDSHEDLVTIPKPRIFIDAISLDEEIQLERELIEEEYKPVRAAWDAFQREETGLIQLPMQEFEPRPHWHLNSRQKEFLQHLIFVSEVGYWSVKPLVRRIEFKTALELLREKWGDYPISKLTEAANLMWELRAVV